MKEKTVEANTVKSPLDSSRNLFLNISIVILSVIILYLGYSLLDKLNVFSPSDENNDLLKQKKPLQVEVLNGCGAAGIADEVTELLRKKNFDVVNTGNYRTFNIDDSIIIDRAGNIKNAYVLAKAIGMDERRVVEQKNKNYFLDITLIVGKDYKQLFQIN